MGQLDVLANVEQGYEHVEHVEHVERVTGTRRIASSANRRLEVRTCCAH